MLRGVAARSNTAACARPILGMAVSELLKMVGI